MNANKRLARQQAAQNEARRNAGRGPGPAPAAGQRPLMPQPVLAMLKMLRSSNGEEGAVAVVDLVGANAEALLELGLNDPAAVTAIRDWCAAVSGSFGELIARLDAGARNAARAKAEAAAEAAATSARAGLAAVPPAAPDADDDDNSDGAAAEHKEGDHDGTDSSDGHGDHATVGVAEPRGLDQPAGHRHDG